MMQGVFKANKLFYQKHEHYECLRGRTPSIKSHWAEKSVSMGKTCMDKIFQKATFFWKMGK